MGPQRPNLLGLLCWILILGGLGLLVITMRKAGGPSFAESLDIYPYSPPVAEILLFAPLPLMIVAGICMYERQGWARYLYLVVMVPFFIHTHFTIAALNKPGATTKYPLYHHGLQVAELLYLASAVYLFTRPVRRYYRPPQYVDE